MRKLILAIGTIFALAGVAQADATSYTQETIGTNEEAKELRLNRYVFDAMGQEADISGTCAGGTAQQVEMHRSATDVLAGVFSLGWYTPVHVRVKCGAPTR